MDILKVTKNYWFTRRNPVFRFLPQPIEISKIFNTINQRLARLQSNIAKINPELTVNPEVLLTVKVENLHAVSYFKHPTCMQLDYARDFRTTALESAKRMTQWSAFYFTHSTSYYPVPSTQIHLQDFPRMTQQNLPVMSSVMSSVMRNWANTHSKCDNAPSNKKPPSIRLVLFLWTCIRLLSTRENG